jgi:hypothetical protein
MILINKKKELQKYIKESLFARQNKNYQYIIFVEEKQSIYTIYTNIKKDEDIKAFEDLFKNTNIVCTNYEKGFNYSNFRLRVKSLKKL